MLIPRRLDDQSYADIVAEAEARLPWLCPVWTDHNAHDPGITLLELMAWYKELQQYHMDQITPGHAPQAPGACRTAPFAGTAGGVHVGIAKRRARPACRRPADGAARPAL